LGGNDFGSRVFAHSQYIVISFPVIPVTNRRPLTVCFTAGPALRVPADWHVVLHIRHHRDADFWQHPVGPHHGNQQAQQFPNVCPGSNAIVSVIIIMILYIDYTDLVIL